MLLQIAFKFIITKFASVFNQTTFYFGWTLPIQFVKNYDQLAPIGTSSCKSTKDEKCF